MDADAKPFVIEAAVNGGITTRAANPTLPCTAGEVAADATAALAAGAAVVHYHLRDPDGGRITDYQQLLAEHVSAVEAIRSGPAPLLWNTFPVGGDREERFRLFRDLSARPATRPDVGAHDIGSLNLVWYDDARGRWTSHTYVNTFDDVCWFMTRYRELGLRPFLNVFEPGFLRAALAALDMGLLEEPLLVKLYFSDRYGLPPGREGVETYLRLLDGVRHEWFGCYIDGDVLPFVPLFASMGGHVRVGLEDFAYAGEPPLANAEIVARAAAAAVASGRPVATVAQAVALLGL